MVRATNVDATAVNTIRWLSAGDWTIVVPVYQRQYRWDIGACEQLLSDIRAVADLDDRHMHFIGSILSSTTAGDHPELVLIDGQQRITTIMLLVAALQHAVRDSDPEMAAELARVLVHPRDADATKLRPHRAWAEVFERVVLDRRGAGDGTRDSRFDDNYAFFRSQVSADEAPHIWRGLQKLEHVAITLRAGANAQQIFESLNSTGEPLRDHELIHNYVLMGLSHDEQREVESEYWLPIERNTGDSIAEFWRQYLIMTTGREVVVARGRGVYDTFRQVFPRLEIGDLRRHASHASTKGAPSMKTPRLLLALALIGVAGAAQASGNCTVKLKGDDAMKFDLKEATVSASCATITIELDHTGKLPAAAMGHNVVVSTTADLAGVARDAIRAGVANNYVPTGDARVIAFTPLIGGGQKTKVSFPGNKLTVGGDYSFYCTFPGHSTLMKGKLVVTR